MRRTKRRKSETLYFHNFWHSGAQRGAAFGRPPPSVVSFVLALSKAHVLALNTAHVLRFNNADVLALNGAHVLRLNTQIFPVFTAFGRLQNGGRPSAAPPVVVSFVLAVHT